MSSRTTIGVFGGMFDPIHLGHLRMALELRQALALDEMRLMPCHIPPHRQHPHASAEQRAAMVQLAIRDCPELSIDESELANPEPSFSIHSLEILRNQLGEEVSLCLAVGMDSLVNLNTWHRWRELLNLAHIVVAARPGWREPQSGEMADYLARFQGEPQDLQLHTRGKIVIEKLTLLPISSTEIRKMIQKRQSPQFLVPDSVWHYIREQHLYEYNH